MRQVTRVITRKSIITVAAAGGMIALGGGYAHASSGASGAASDSPGVASGNTVQVPVHAPVNVCGNTVSVVGLLNPAFGNSCANQSGSGGPGSPGSPDSLGGYGDEGGSQAGGHGSDSPGVGSGNTVEVPIDAPVNVCGNSVTGVGAGNAAYGDDCGYGVEPTTPGHPETPGTPSTPPQGEGEHPGTPETPGTPGGSHGPNTPSTRSITPNGPTEELASTGAGPLGLIVPAGAGLLLAGSVIYRRARSAA